MNREICDHGNEANKCKVCEVILILNQLLNVMPQFPENGNAIYGYKSKYEQAIKNAKKFIQEN